VFVERNRSDTVGQNVFGRGCLKSLEIFCHAGTGHFAENHIPGGM
jgi:hypothetical protein